MRVTYLVDSFPELTQTFVAGEIRELGRLGHEVVVESSAHPANPAAGVADGLEVHYLIDETRGSRLRALVALVARHPLRCLRDLAARRRWRRQEAVRPLRWLAPAARRVAESGADHLHAHFAASTALDAMRIARLEGVPYSVMTHGYDIFRRPSNLAEKLERARFAASPCDYSSQHLRELAPSAHVHTVVMGVDGEAFARDRPYPETRTVIAVGRLVEKKGFAHLAAAAERLDARVVIVGDGPEHDALAQSPVELVGARSHEDVRDLMQDAAVLVMPCVIAADGDRDTMPVVVKEALALGMPVVASDAVGLPEVVRPAWGRLVAPGDSAALAAAINELLALRPEVRAAMGAAGRAHVLEHCSLRGQAERLVELIASA